MPRHIVIIVFVVVVLNAGPLWAQTGAEPIVPHGLLEGADSLGAIVDSIVIDNQPVYDVSDSKYDHWIFRLANRFHVTTRENVIRRELLFEQGEPYPYVLAEETARNLRSRLQLYDAFIEVDTLDNGHLLVRVVTIDEWTLAAGPNLSHEANRTEYDLTISERNLLGRNQEISASYAYRDYDEASAIDDEGYVDLSYFSPRLWGNPYSFRIAYRTDPRNGFESIQLAHPYYSLSQDMAWSVSVRNEISRQDIFNNDSLIAQSKTKGDQIVMAGLTRTGSYRRKLELQTTYKYNFERTFDRRIFATNPELVDQAERSFGADSVYHQTDLGIGVSNFNFTTAINIDGFSYTEDFTLGQHASVIYGRAFQPGLQDHLYDRTGFSVSQGYELGNLLFYGSYFRTYWFRGSESIRRTSIFASRLYGRFTDYLTLAFRGVYRSDWRPTNVEPLALGAEGGIRGFYNFFRTGDRLVVTNFEVRLFPGIRLHSALFGAVVFTDAGQIWSPGDDFSFDHLYASVGAGLRVGFEHSSRDHIIRVDAAYSEAGGWQLSVGTNHYFEAPRNDLSLTTP